MMSVNFVDKLLLKHHGCNGVMVALFISIFLLLCDSLVYWKMKHILYLKLSALNEELNTLNMIYNFDKIIMKQIY